MREYPTLNALRRGETVDVEGVKVKMVAGGLTRGDLYVIERNGLVRLLTVKSVHPRGWVDPVEWPAYNYAHECVKVERLEGDDGIRCGVMLQWLLDRMASLESADPIRGYARWDQWLRWQFGDEHAEKLIRELWRAYGVGRRSRRDVSDESDECDGCR